MIQNTISSNVGIKHRRLDSKQVLFIEKLWHQLLHTTLLMSSSVPLQDWQEFHPTTPSHTISLAGAPSGHHGSTQAELSSALLLSTPDLQTPGPKTWYSAKPSNLFEPSSSSYTTLANYPISNPRTSQGSWHSCCVLSSNFVNTATSAPGTAL